MKTQLLILSLFVCLFSYAQKKAGYVTAEGGLEFSKNFNPDVSLRLGGALPLSKSTYAGANAGLMELSGRDKMSVPIAFTLRYMPESTKGKMSPLFALEPGYHFYNAVTVIGSKQITTKGGFALYAGGGIRYKKMTYAVGYSQYDFSVDGLNHTEHRVTGKVGVIF